MAGDHILILLGDLIRWRASRKAWTQDEPVVDRLLFRADLWAATGFWLRPLREASVDRIARNDAMRSLCLLHLRTLLPSAQH